ncbi:MAG TPA: PEP-CTERM sorting domain-containing protein [Verrucomicrobiae bacterium]|nr:PEP-CTERM sorting domain-containing protein [Verrucomicrobiae bacterium]
MNNSFLHFRRWFLPGVAAVCCALTAQAQNVTLTSGNSQATINLSAVGGGTGTAGMNSWTINGQNQLEQQWFWFRVGDDSTGQHSLDSLGTPSYTYTGNVLDAVYTGVGFNIEVSYTLNGGTPGNWDSDISENISIQNTSATAQTFHFFQYSDFALAGSQGNETATIYQDGGFFSKATVSKGANQLAETIDEPLANRGEAGLAQGLPSDTLAHLNSGSIYDLNNNLFDGPVPEADATWALQWDTLINAGDTATIIKDKHLEVVPTPEPGTLAIFAAGFGALLLRRNRRSV